jgi:hypothetical protein
MLRRVADVSEERNASVIRVTRIGELETLAVTTNRRILRSTPSSSVLVTLMMEVICFSETSVLTGASRRNIPEDGILHSHRCEDLKSYIALTGWAL